MPDIEINLGSTPIGGVAEGTDPCRGKCISDEVRKSVQGPGGLTGLHEITNINAAMEGLPESASAAGFVVWVVLSFSQRRN